MKAFNVYDTNLNRIGTIETWVSLLWNEGYNTLGSFCIEVQQTKEVSELIKVGNYVGRSDFKTLCLIRSVEVKDNTIVANGHPAVSILGERISTAVIKNQNAEQAMRGLVENMSKWPCVELGEIAGFTDEFERQISDKTLLEYCEEICAEFDMGFTLRYDKKTKKLLFEIYRPEIDKNLKYATKFGNLAEVVYSETDTQYKNVAIVAGEGEGEERVTVYAGDVDSSGAERRELYVDARSIQKADEDTEETYKQKLVDFGLEKLAENIKIENISVQIATEDFGKTVELGDIITCILNDIGVKLQSRIIAFTYTSQRNTDEIEVEFGTPIIRR
ncbi:MAG: siphovirus ReqiPepy6 Gp37-like family protein [Bacteroidales bacterium]|nr:siphovirus ReqiPepy6 Gp37-like family protein [Bacteroidales bacterium]